ncbi:MAG: PfkB family carbohydrate kinase [Veillonella parvula]
MKVLLNPASSGRASTFGMDLELATYITPNEHELSALYPNQSTEEILLANENKIIVTLGSKGVGYADNGEIHIVPGFKVEPVDTTGAGDTFNGAFATAIVNGKSLADALHYGNAAAAFSSNAWGLKVACQQEQVAAFLADDMGERH